MNHLKKTVFPVALLTLALLWGCDQHDVAKQQESAAQLSQSRSSDTELRDSIGKWHNRSLDFLIEKGINKDDDLNYAEKRNLLIDKLGKESDLFDKQSMRRKAGGSNKTLVEAGILKTTDGKATLEGNYKSLYSHLDQQGKISDHLHRALVDVQNRAEKSSMSATQFVEYAEKHLKGSAQAKSEQVHVDAALQTLRASNRYWNGPTKNNTGCTLGIIWADAAGTVYGSTVSGPFGVVEGALFSSMVAIQPDC